jgi:sulfur-carrier protein
MSESSTATIVSVRVVYLARLREAFGTGGESLLLAPEVRDVGSLLRLLRERGGAWASELSPQRAVRVAVNHAMAAPDAPIRDGDEVALFPPVTGG